MRLARLLPLLLLAACDYERSNVFDPEYEGTAEIAAPPFVAVGTRARFEMRFSEPQENRPRYLWTSDSPSHLRFLPPCILDETGSYVVLPCGEGEAIGVRAGTVRVSARYFGPRAADEERVYSKLVEVRAP